VQKHTTIIIVIFVKGLEPEGKLTNRLGLYPMRIHSLFSTIARALQLVKATEDARKEEEDIDSEIDLVSSLPAVAAATAIGHAVANAPPRKSKSWSEYDVIVVTRLDIVRLVRFRGPFTKPKDGAIERQQSGTWWEDATK